MNMNDFTSRLVILSVIVLPLVICAGAVGYVSTGSSLPIVISLGLILMLIGIASSYGKHLGLKRSNALLLLNILGGLLFIWGIFKENYALILISFVFMVLSAIISVLLYRSSPEYQYTHIARRRISRRARKSLDRARKARRQPSRTLPTYEQGYQAQRMGPFAVRKISEEPAASLDRLEYEQPLVSYPDLPPLA
jgi:hypothetical protein